MCMLILSLSFYFCGFIFFHSLEKTSITMCSFGWDLDNDFFFIVMGENTTIIYQRSDVFKVVNCT